MSNVVTGIACTKIVLKILSAQPVEELIPTYPNVSRPTPDCAGKYFPVAALVSPVEL